MSEEPQAPVTEDHLLGGRVRLRQPAEGARAAIDPVFLAAAVAAEPSHTVLDLGCGTGAAMLCLAARVPQCRIVGLEMQRDLVRIAGDNVILNGMSGRVSVMIGDLMAPPPRLAPGAYDHVMANPPYLAQGTGKAPGTAGKAAATIEGEADLGEWVRFALMMLRAKGTLHFIHRADRIDTVLAQLSGRAGEVTVFPLWPDGQKPASRVLVRARKQVASPARLLPGLVLHEPDGRFTAAAEAVLRGGAALAM
ncbi:MAG TPA: methyltransferase [Stellaceae bacterium]|nr:methyltransferase [Stellaceae bacterium]